MSRPPLATRLALLPLIGLALPGCSGSRIEVTPLAPEATDLRGEIRVTTGDLDVPYDEIALVSVGPFDETKDLLRALRAAARKAGADAVVRVDFDVYGSGESGSQARMASGTAVRYR